MDTKIALIALSALITAGCQTEETTEKKQSVEVVENSVTESTEAYIPSDRAEQKAYALGSTVAIRMSMELEQSAEIGVEIDKNYVLQGITDTLTGSSLITPAASSELLEELTEDIASTVAQLEKEAGLQ